MVPWPCERTETRIEFCVQNHQLQVGMKVRCGCWLWQNRPMILGQQHRAVFPWQHPIEHECCRRVLCVKGKGPAGDAQHRRSVEGRTSGRWARRAAAACSQARQMAPRCVCRRCCLAVKPLSHRVKHANRTHGSFCFWFFLRQTSAPEQEAVPPITSVTTSSDTNVWTDVRHNINVTRKPAAVTTLHSASLG